MSSMSRIAKGIFGRMSLLASLMLPAAAAWSQPVTVSIQGQVTDKAGIGVNGAVIRILETNLTTQSDASGNFDLKGTFEVGVIRRSRLPGGALLDSRRGRLSLRLAGNSPLAALLVGPDGRSQRRMLDGTQAVAGRVDLEAWLGPAAGAWFLRLGDGSDARTFRLTRSGRGAVVTIHTQAARSLGGSAPAPKVAAAAPGGNLADTLVLLEVTAAGFHPKRVLSLPVQSDRDVKLIAANAPLKERIQDFIGSMGGYKNFRLAFLKKESPTSRKHILHLAELSQMTGDTLPITAFPDSRGPANPESTPFGANVPSISPDGSLIAYEIGNESQTVNNVSQIWLQPITGTRVPGPGFPATNPRWWVDGPDRYLIWCTNGREDGWKDTASRTMRQKVAGGALTGSPEVIVKGSFNGGMSGTPANRYLAAAFRHGVMLEAATSTLRHFHIYPGHGPAKDGSPADSLQACNPSISPNPQDPTRMLFLDFGVPPGENPYPNKVRPQHYAQHQMILVGDFKSEGPGRIVDFIDSPPAELAKDKTWDDPEWSNHPDFAVATTRDPKGDLSNPGEPRPTQPDIYLIHLPTKSSLKVISGDHFTMPALWLGE